MTTKEKAQMISDIISKMKFEADNLKRPFDAGDIFLSLCFRSDSELKEISRLVWL